MSNSDNAPALPTSEVLGKAQSYLVLARKYRPQTLDDLIGQDILVRTLRNAFAMDRIAQAYMLTGVRGVGKTTTARILARALNYERDGLPDRPSLDIAELGRHCQAIMDSRHVDVLEMDAASNTGIDDIREIIEAVRYKPAAARYRVFIIDEVHMLSKSAFNGLLKTLEEPPPHVKFIFATTEIRKVPVTILSRCQRFDLRRVEPEVLSAHFARILEKEGYAADDSALALIARAAEGSVRDGLSLLDQALTMAEGRLTAAAVLDMLGLSGRDAIFDLLERIFDGDAAGALTALGALNERGADPTLIISDAADAVHALSRLKVLPGAYPHDLSADDRARADRLAASLPVPRLAMAWQMLLKGIDEAARAPRPLAAAEMLVIRMCYTAQLPSPADVIGELKRGGGERAPVRESASGAPARDLASGAPNGGFEPARPRVLSSRGSEAVAQSSAEAPREAPRSFASFEEIVEKVRAARDIMLQKALEERVELVKFGPGFLELRLLEGAPQSLAPELAKKLQAWTGERWIVSLSEERGLPPLGARMRDEKAQAKEEIRKHPAVKSILHHFPDAEITDVRKLD
ncbi:DNA polymerase III subunits gamma and tau [Rhodomicrobium udaipurense JA643]|uniref:DNA polymerase III subunit gamma/tau n=1 Tax=Rhodomicrobium udaipurense TaxID=1202716 RepID=A0A8I1GAX7_9HYPH|nr:DNA polymerase III subunit gamma/tau [Rhodomicrobium udaipurense]KAI94864.1 DNA polymerase III subunits gamma and tau [Rhodomicrobium udaipurense JA643]MBJ7542370.1 DNA polymerase III subunit gamma/tau [Rhodomicrobium udaipurense]